jgi:hypothetical protein
MSKISDRPSKHPKREINHPQVTAVLHDITRENVTPLCSYTLVQGVAIVLDGTARVENDMLDDHFSRSLQFAAVLRMRFELCVLIKIV